MIWRWFWREWRSPSLLIVWLALTLSVACVLALGSISDRMDKGLSQQSRDFIAGDRVLRSAHPVPEGWLLDAQQQGLTLSRQLSFTTMTYAGDRPQLADVKATDLAYPLPDGSKALRFDQIAFAAFELHILQRAGAEADYTPQERSQAAAYFAAMSEEEKNRLTGNIIAGLPGAEEGYTLEQFRRRLAEYDGIDKARLRENMAVFLRAIVPVAEEVGIRLAVHPDDPPRPILGLPRIVSTIEDMQWLKQTVDSIYNGFTLCTGSYGVRADNDLVRMIETFGDRIHFTHLRATCREENPKSFHEGAHLQGDVDMVAVIEAILTEELRRQRAGDRRPIPMRPDHGHQMLDDLKKKTNPGYSAIGRLKGLAELRGVELALKRRFFPELP